MPNHIDNATRSEVVEFILSNKMRLRSFDNWMSHKKAIQSLRGRYVVFTLVEAGKILSMSPDTVRRRCHQLKIGKVGGHYLLTNEQIEKISKFVPYFPPGKYEL